MLTKSISKNRIDADLLVKIEVRRKIDADERITDPNKQLEVIYHVSPEMQELDSFAVFTLVRILVKATNEVLEKM